MKRQLFTFLTAGALLTSFTVRAFANSSALDSNKRNAVSRLEEHTQRLEQHVQTTTGGGRQVFELQRRQVQDLIDRIKAGESVNPQEIDKLLRENPQ
ncbi:MAG: hypothetical protein HY267_07350 [Deltaproteobacteria bacterium]|nr:hypothetical protein [Deltaproteobacteria bacterium]